MRGSTLETDQLGLNPSSAAYQLDLESYSSSLIFTFLICKMGIDIARHPRYLCEFKGTHDARSPGGAWNATPRSLPSLERKIRSRTHA